MPRLGGLLMVAMAAAAGLVSIFLVPMAASADDGIVGGVGQVASTVIRGDDGGAAGGVIETAAGVLPAPADQDTHAQAQQSEQSPPFAAPQPAAPAAVRPAASMVQQVAQPITAAPPQIVTVDEMAAGVSSLGVTPSLTEALTQASGEVGMPLEQVVTPISGPALPPLGTATAPAGTLLEPALGSIQRLTPVVQAVTVPLVETLDAVAGTVEAVSVVGPVLAPVLDVGPVVEGMPGIPDLLTAIGGPPTAAASSEGRGRATETGLALAPDVEGHSARGIGVALPDGGPTRSAVPQASGHRPDLTVAPPAIPLNGTAGLPPSKRDSRSADRPATRGLLDVPPAFIAGMAATLQSGSQLQVAFLSVVLLEALLLVSWRLALATGGPPDQPVFLLLQPPR